ncbi:hypothetical protein GGR42_003013 [Saonia flava]|uniref:Uncharacterized protein n=1 Tax=Saonia flava TaxID=523696 RepID=A0A846R0P4_9FLAO|nr:hypothetical protein [Saonia flava]NJB72522.1 hypothetical protein [Saonia flava]
MEKQYCKVGAVTPITSGAHAISLLEYQYRNFMDKASSTKSVDQKLANFFEFKAIKVKKMLENLV